MRVAVIGGGASGFFSAISVKQNYPSYEVIIFEKSKNFLSKVKLTGGGRCNVTNACSSIKELVEAYPRGGKLLKNHFASFNNIDAMKWFEARGVSLVTQDDNCVFPKTQNSETITNCLINEAKKTGVKIQTNTKVLSINKYNNKLELCVLNNEEVKYNFDKIIVTTGGSPKKNGLDWIAQLGHKIEDTVPSLFTFNMPNESVTKLMGVVVENVLVSLQGTKLNANGPLLITHWGMSGPAILKLSSFGASILSQNKYIFKVQVSWVNEFNFDTVFTALQIIISDNKNKILANYRPYSLPDRLWQFLLMKSELSPKKKWGELGKKGLNKLVNILTNDIYTVEGKTTFKEEFVTCGGVSLDSINAKTMQSKLVDGLYFAGEVLDIDGITGGYNLQAAWTTGFIAGKLN